MREFNPAAERVFGHRREAVLGRMLGALIVPEHLRAAHAAGLARLLTTGQSRMVGRRIEIEALRADGGLFRSSWPSSSCGSTASVCSPPTCAT